VQQNPRLPRALDYRLCGWGGSMTDAPKMEPCSVCMGTGLQYDQVGAMVCDECGGAKMVAVGPSIRTIRADAPELVALRNAATRAVQHYAIVHQGPPGIRTAGMGMIDDLSAALAAFDALMEGKP